MRYTLKVNISYAVELEDVPLEVGKLVTTAAYQMSMALEDIRLNCPKIIVLSNKAFESVELKNCIDELERLGRSAIFCVGLPSENYSKVTQKQVQRRIDLLAIEQNAWKLAAYDKRCVVVETKTELDWAIKNGQISVR